MKRFLIGMLLVFFMLAACASIPAQRPDPSPMEEENLPGFVALVTGNAWLSMDVNEQVIFVCGYLNGQYDVAARLGVNAEDFWGIVGMPLTIGQIVARITQYYLTTEDLGVLFVEVFRIVQQTIGETEQAEKLLIPNVS